MRLLRTTTIAFLLLAAIPAFSAEVAVLRNGFSITFERKEVSGETTRLYIRGGYVDVPSTEIASFEPAPPEADAPPDVPAAQPQPSPAPAPVTQTALSTPTSASTQNGAAVSDLDQLVREVSSRYRLDPDFVNSVIKAESNFQIRAVSPKGAQGLMQLMPATAAQLGVSNAFDAKANVEAGTAYLSYLLDQYHDDPIKALAAYNAGAHRVAQYHGVPPYMETRAYVAKIVRDFNAKKLKQMKASGAGNTPAAKAASAGPSVKRKKPKSSQPQQAVVPKPQKPA